MDIARVNLNLLVAFDALMTERHVTRAAERMHLSQSAMSTILGQLRDLFDDELLVRGPKGMIPTPFALSITAQVRDILQKIDETLSQSYEFCPKDSDRLFHIGMSDYAEFAFLPDLVKRLEVEAPNVRLRIFHMTTLESLQPFESGKIELAIGIVCGISPHLQSEFLYSETGRVVGRKGHPLFKSKITLKKYLSARHLSSAYHQPPFIGLVDQTLNEMGHKRHISLATEIAVPAMLVLNQTDLVATTASRIAMHLQKQYKMEVQAMPFKMEPVEVVQAWHRQMDSDPAHRWLRGVISQVSKNI